MEMLNPSARGFHIIKIVPETQKKTRRILLIDFGFLDKCLVETKKNLIHYSGLDNRFDDNGFRQLNADGPSRSRTD